MNEMNQRQAMVDQESDEHMAEQLEPIIKAGQRLETNLSDMMGKPARSALLFPDTEIVIVEEDETVNNQHLSSVQKVIKERLEEIEIEFKSRSNANRKASSCKKKKSTPKLT